MILGRICSCSTLQCGQVKSEYRSMRKGAAGLPTLSTSGPAARQGSIRASARANIFILLCYTKQLHAPPQDHCILNEIVIKSGVACHGGMSRSLESGVCPALCGTGGCRPSFHYPVCGFLRAADWHPFSGPVARERCILVPTL